MAEHYVGIVEDLLHLHGAIGAPANIIPCSKKAMSDSPHTHTIVHISDLVIQVTLKQALTSKAQTGEHNGHAWQSALAKALSITIHRVRSVSAEGTGLHHHCPRAHGPPHEDSCHSQTERQLTKSPLSRWQTYKEAKSYHCADRQHRPSVIADLTIRRPQKAVRRAASPKCTPTQSTLTEPAGSESFRMECEFSRVENWDSKSKKSVTEVTKEVSQEELTFHQKSTVSNFNLHTTHSSQSG